MTNKETRAVFDRLARRYIKEMIGADRPADADKIDATTVVGGILCGKPRDMRMIWRIAHDAAAQALAESGLPRIGGMYILPPVTVGGAA